MNGQKHDPIQEIPKIHAKQFSQEDLSLNNMKTVGSQFVAQIQKNWVISPMNLIQ